MSNLTRAMMMGAAGAAGDSATYVDDVFGTFLYEGTGSEQSINNGIDLSGEGGLTWIKNRSEQYDHQLISTEQSLKVLISNNNNAGVVNLNNFKQFNSNGFTIGPYNHTNKSGNNYVSWSFRKQKGFFDVVAWTGNGVNGRTIAHNLGSVPGMIFVKRLSNTSNWEVWHRSLANDEYLSLNQTNGKASGGPWNNTAPTSTHFTVSADSDVNASSETYIAYVFAHDDAQFGTDEDESIIKCGSFTTSSSKATVNLGFEPQWVMFKGASGASPGNGWEIYNSMTGLANGSYTRLLANDSAAEVSGGVPVCVATSTGFEIENTNNNTTFIYMAIRRPHKPPEVATEVFAVDTGNSSSTIPAFDSGFPVDFAIQREYNTTADNFTFSRLTGSKVMRTNNSTSEVNGGSLWIADSNVGWSKSYNNTNISWMFKRAPGFFDVVAYNGSTNYAVQNIPHSLTVVPEMFLLKGRSFSDNWMAYHKDVGNNKQFFLQSADAPGTNIDCFNSTTPTASVFTVGADGATNRAGTYIALLFATLPGISKVGSYTGTGSAQNIDCGFTNGARFILIKKTSASGDWYVYDTTRGISSGNEPFIMLNNTSAQSSANYIGPHSSGFAVTTETALNGSGATYIFLAIA